MDYKSTLNLPKTDFPVRANLPEREPEILRQWEAEGLYQRLRAARAGPPAGEVGAAGVLWPRVRRALPPPARRGR